MITIKDMAEMLGISTTTISNVIHGKTSEVSKKTVEKVQMMLEEYNYIPNINARNLAQNQSRIIGVALKAWKDKYENMISDPFMGELIGAIEKEVRKKGYFFMMYISDDINEIIQYVSTWNADGLILVGMLHDDYIKVKRKYKKPMVTVDSYAPKDAMNYVNVGLEDQQGSYEITRFLIKNGHTKIAFISDNLEGVDYIRYLGYKKAMLEYHLACDEEDIILIRPSQREIESSLREIYALSFDYTAFACTSDYYAVTIMNYLADHGRSIPEDISITGFDDNLFSRMCRPTLTTVHQNVTKKGESSVEVLVDMIQNKVLKAKDITLPIRLTIRDSVKKLNQPLKA